MTGNRALLAVIALCALVFAMLAALAAGAEPGAHDRALYLLFRDAADASRSAGPDWLREAARDITALGSTLVLGIATFVAMAVLLLRRRVAPALLLFAAVPGGQLLVSLLKLAFDRARPDLAPHAAQVFTTSFPSGHAALSATACLTLALLARAMLGRAPPAAALPAGSAGNRGTALILAIGLLLPLLIGLSRIHLGVHWPSDVLAGWALGYGWALSCWLAFRHLSVRQETAPGADRA